MSAKLCYQEIKIMLGIENLWPQQWTAKLNSLFLYCTTDKSLASDEMNFFHFFKMPPEESMTGKVNLGIVSTLFLANMLNLELQSQD